MDTDRKRHCFSWMAEVDNVPVLSLSAVTDEEVHPLENEDVIWKKTL